jgi:hypothetical protein
MLEHGTCCDSKSKRSSNSKFLDSHSHSVREGVSLVSAMAIRLNNLEEALVQIFLATRNRLTVVPRGVRWAGLPHERHECACSPVRRLRTGSTGGNDVRKMMKSRRQRAGHEGTASGSRADVRVKPNHPFSMDYESQITMTQRCMSRHK